MNIAPIGFLKFQSNDKNKANTSFGMKLSPTGQITTKLALQEKVLTEDLFCILRDLHLAKPNPAPATDDVLLGFERFDGSDGPLAATLITTKDPIKDLREEFAPNNFQDAYTWAINPKTIEKLRAQ